MHSKAWNVAWIAVSLIGSVGTCPDLTAQAPEVLVAEGVRSFTLKEPKVFWHTPSNCIPGIDGGPPTNADKPEVLTRVATSGGIHRELLREDPTRPVNVCNPYHFFSDVVADDDYVYWVDPTGLVRLSTDANVGDPPELLDATITGDEETRRAELALTDDALYVRAYDGSSSRIYRVAKSTGIAVLQQTISGVRTTRLSWDGKYVYWIQGTNLRRAVFGRGGSLTTIANGVTGYYAEGRRTRLVIPGGSTSTEYVYIGKGRQLVRYDNVTDETSAALYTSSDPSAVIYSVTSLGGGALILLGQPSGVFFLERRTVVPPPPAIFSSYDQLLFRVPRGGGAADLLYYRSGSLPVTIDADDLTSNGTFLFWKDQGRVLRLPADAEALPKINMRITGMEVTQAIQNLQNTVRLVEDKRTFVRLHVRSDDPAEAVSGVYAHLTAVWSGGSGGPLAPINSIGSKITVHPSPDRNDINQSFLFELPLSWTRQSDLRIFGWLNPHKLPLQTSYANNLLILGPFEFEPSPRLEARFIAFEYEAYGSEYSPDYFDDVLPTFSWIRRVYPLASGPGDIHFPGQGFRPSIWYVFDGDLGDKVIQIADDCQKLKTEEADNRNLCASAYTNSRMQAWQTEYGDQRFYYGMISDGASFPRGQASGRVSSGPVGTPSSTSWDTDTTYGDWYAGHEVGHTLGRGHPDANGDDPDTKDTVEGCGHWPADPSYPYAKALIGPAGGSLAGFDAGGGNLKPAVMPRTLWADIMSYCDYQWISDYTYEAMLDRLIAEGGGGGGAARIAGDWLSAFGVIAGDGESAVFHHTRRVPEVASIPPSGRGPYELRLLNGGGGLLAAHAFTPDRPGETNLRGFGLVVPFKDGTRQLRIVRASDGAVLASQTVSSGIPDLASTTLEGAGGAPLTGLRLLDWAAGDPDGDPLRFDVLYSRDGGVSFQPLLWNVTDTRVPINTDELPGGAGRLRVIATDGVQCSEADSPPFTLALKPPRPRILAPTDGTRVQYGQLVTIIGEADDPQDGSVAPSRLVWSGLGGTRRLTTGPVIAVDDLPVGTNTVTLTATNSAGLSATASIQVIVHDDLRVPGSTLSASPTQVGWNVTAGSTQIQTASVLISNIGAGSLDWSATDDAPWLTLSSTSGTAPTSIGLQANPQGLTPDASHVAIVTISNDRVPGQLATVRVTLSLGCMHCGAFAPGGGPTSRFLRGDGNGDGRIDLSDAIATFSYLFLGGPPPACPDAADTRDEGVLTITSGVYLLNYLFLGGPAPPPPFEDCGTDPTADSLGSCRYDSAKCP